MLLCLRLSFIWHTKVKAKSNWSVKNYMKADHNTIMPFGIKVMWNYKVLSKCERCMIKKNLHFDMVWFAQISDWPNHQSQTLCREHQRSVGCYDLKLLENMNLSLTILVNWSWMKLNLLCFETWYFHNFKLTWGLLLEIYYRHWHSPWD